MTFTHHFYNVASSGSIDYLSEGEQPLPFVYTLFSLGYALAFAAWVRLVRSAKSADAASGAAPRIHHVHHLMSFLLLIKSLTVFSDAMKWRYTRWTGSGEAWSVFYYLFSFLKGMLLFVVILLIGR